jgi:hypothetical protein
MKSAIRTLCVGLMVGTFFSLPATGFAESPPGTVASLLAGTGVSDRDLGNQSARGVVLGPLTGSVTDNTSTSYGGTGGLISNTGSFNYDTGITTVFQNTGNNSLFQNQTIVNVTIH